jgi:outer membrane immunogenic protein
MRLKDFVRTGVVALAAAGIAMATPASAADGYNGYGGGSLKDQPLYLPPTWTGFYLGGHVGGAWSANDENNRVDVFTFPAFEDRPQRSVLIVGDHKNNDISGVFGGIQFGYNWQNVGWFNPNWLLGIEIDLGGFGTDDNHRRLFATDGAGNSVFIRGPGGASGFYGDLTGRIGYAWNSVLFYGKGGFAWLNSGSDEVTETLVLADGTTTFFRNDTNDRTLMGWTAGGGIEYMINPNWSLKVEYLYFDFTQDDRRCCFDGIVDRTTGVPLNNFNFGNDLRFNTVKVGFNYILRPPAPMPMK